MVERIGARIEAKVVHSRIFELRSPSFFPSGVRRKIIDIHLGLRYRGSRQIGEPEMMVERDGHRVFLAHGIFESEKRGLSPAIATLIANVAISQVRMLGKPIEEIKDSGNNLLE